MKKNESEKVRRERKGKREIAATFPPEQQKPGESLPQRQVVPQSRNPRFQVDHFGCVQFLPYQLPDDDLLGGLLVDLLSLSFEGKFRWESDPFSISFPMILLFRVLNGSEYTNNDLQVPDL